MIQYVSKENKFSVESNTFSVAPTSSGYTLNYSADGITFTAWDEATAANENLIVNGCAKGQVFKLVGNTDDNVRVIY